MKKIKSVLTFFLGAFFIILSNGNYLMAIAAWIYPALILQITRKMKPGKVVLLMMLTFGLCFQLTFWNFSSTNPRSILFYVPGLGALLYFFPFFLDRVVTSRFKGFVSTLAFPIAYTALDYLFTVFNPMGSFGVLAYSQYNFYPIVQLASVTGLWGITFMVTWFGSVLVWALKNRENNSWYKGAVIYTAILAFILVGGSLRLIMPQQEDTVRVAGLHVYDLRGDEGQQIFNTYKNDYELFTELSKRIQEKLSKMTIQQAIAGAKIIVWSEISVPIDFQDKENFLTNVQKLAADNKIYLVVAPYIMRKNQERDENVLFIINDEGEIVLEHYKYGGNTIEGVVPGDKIIRFVDTKYGRISGVICWDMDFPAIIRQTGKLDIDILLSPAADWIDINPAHTRMASFRAVENGFSLVRQTINGLSIATDAKGNILSSMDHYTAREWIMNAQVPIKGGKTLYSFLGDWFAWSTLIGLLVFIAAVVRNKPINDLSTKT